MGGGIFSRVVASVAVFTAFLTMMAPSVALSQKGQKTLYRLRNTLGGYRRGTMEQESQAAKQVLADDPNNGDAYAALGYIAYVHGDRKSAQEKLLKAIELKPTLPFFRRTAYNYAYHTYLDQQDWKSAVKLALQCFEIRKSFIVAHDIALLYGKLGDQPNARKYSALEQGLRLETQHIMQATNDMKYPEKRQDLLKRINAKLAKDPSDETFLLLRSRVYRLEKDYEKSVEDLNRLIAMDPSDGSLYVLRAQAYKELDDETKANADIQVAKDYGLDIAQDLSDSLDASSPLRVDAALKRANAALKANPKDLSALSLRAHCYLTKREDAKARADLDTIVASEPNAPEVYFMRARYLMKMKDYKNADIDLQKARDLFKAAAAKKRKSSGPAMQKPVK